MFTALSKIFRTRLNAFRKEREEHILRFASIQQFYFWLSLTWLNVLMKELAWMLSVLI